MLPWHRLPRRGWELLFSYGGGCAARGGLLRRQMRRLRRSIKGIGGKRRACCSHQLCAQAKPRSATGSPEVQPSQGSAGWLYTIFWSSSQCCESQKCGRGSTIEHRHLSCWLSSVTFPIARMGTPTLPEAYTVYRQRRDEHLVRDQECRCSAGPASLQSLQLRTQQLPQAPKIAKRASAKLTTQGQTVAAVLAPVLRQSSTMADASSRNVEVVRGYLDRLQDIATTSRFPHFSPGVRFLCAAAKRPVPLTLSVTSRCRRASPPRPATPFSTSASTSRLPNAQQWANL